MGNADWMNDPRLGGIDREKLDLLQQLADQGSKKSQSDLMPFLAAAAASGKKQGMQFSGDEIGLIIEAIKMGKSPEEQARMDKIVQMMRLIRK